MRVWSSDLQTFKHNKLSLLMSGPLRIVDGKTTQTPHEHCRIVLNSAALRSYKCFHTGSAKLSFSIPHTHQPQDFVNSKHFGEARKAVAACSTCRVAFESVGDQRIHYQTQWHGFNVSKKAQDGHKNVGIGSDNNDWQPVSEMEFDRLVQQMQQPYHQGDIVIR